MKSLGKVTTLAITGSLALLVSACSSSTSSPSTGGASSAGASSSSAGKTYKMVMIPGTAGDEFYFTTGLGAKAKAKELGIDLEIQLPAKFDPADQVPILQAAILKKPDAILIAPTDSKALAAPIKQAVDAGIKVIAFDTTLDDPSSLTSYVSTDNVQAGEAIGTVLSGLIGDKGKSLFISVSPGVSTTDAWIKGYTTVMSGKPNVTQLPVQYSDNEETKAAQLITGTLQANPDLAGAFLGNLVSTRGSISGLKQAGKLGQIRTVAFDATPSEVADLKAGSIDAIVSVPAGEEGSIAVETAFKALNGETVEKIIALKNCTITKENLTAPDIQPCIYQPLAP